MMGPRLCTTGGRVEVEEEEAEDTGHVHDEHCGHLPGHVRIVIDTCLLSPFPVSEFILDCYYAN